MNEGPKLSDFLTAVLAEKNRHIQAWGENCGLDRIFGENINPGIVEGILEHFGVGDVIPLDRLEGLLDTIKQLDDVVLMFQGAIELKNPHRVLPIPNVVLLGHPDAKVMWSCADDATASLGNVKAFSNGGDCFIDSGWNEAPVLLLGLNHTRTEEFCHKTLAAAGLVPWRHGENLDVDQDHDGLYWIRWDSDTLRAPAKWHLEDA